MNAFLIKKVHLDNLKVISRTLERDLQIAALLLKATGK